VPGLPDSDWADHGRGGLTGPYPTGANQATTQGSGIVSGSRSANGIGW